MQTTPVHKNQQPKGRSNNVDSPVPMIPLHERTCSGMSDGLNECFLFAGGHQSVDFPIIQSTTPAPASGSSSMVLTPLSLGFNHPQSPSIPRSASNSVVAGTPPVVPSSSGFQVSASGVIFVGRQGFAVSATSAAFTSHVPRIPTTPIVAGSGESSSSSGEEWLRLPNYSLEEVASLCGLGLSEGIERYLLVPIAETSPVIRRQLLLLGTGSGGSPARSDDASDAGSQCGSSSVKGISSTRASGKTANSTAVVEAHTKTVHLQYLDNEGDWVTLFPTTTTTTMATTHDLDLDLTARSLLELEVMIRSGLLGELRLQFCVHLILDGDTSSEEQETAPHSVTEQQQQYADPLDELLKPSVSTTQHHDQQHGKYQALSQREVLGTVVTMGETLEGEYRSGGRSQREVEVVEEGWEVSNNKSFAGPDFYGPHPTHQHPPSSSFVQAPQVSTMMTPRLGSTVQRPAVAGLVPPSRASNSSTANTAALGASPGPTPRQKAQSCRSQAHKTPLTTLASWFGY